jgi:hypothetical protein
MKNILISTLITMLCFILTYFVVAFCEAEINFKLWDAGSRVLCMLFAISCSALFTRMYFLNEEGKL